MVAALCDESAPVRNALLPSATKVAVFFGRQMTRDTLLPMLITFLNDRDWELRAALFDNLTDMSVFVGRDDTTAFIVPCILSALTDYEHVVIEHALNALASLCELGLLDKHTMVDVLRRQGMNMVIHPSLCVRAAAVSVILAIARTLSLTEAHTKLLPVLRPFLKTADVVLITEDTLLEELRPPVSRAEFDRLIHSDSKTAENLLAAFDSVADVVEAKYSLGCLNFASASQASQNAVNHAFAQYDPSGAIDFEDREKLILMRSYVRHTCSATQAKIAMWESENMERLRQGAQLGGEMTAYYTLSESIGCYRRPVGGESGPSNIAIVHVAIIDCHQW